MVNTDTIVRVAIALGVGILMWIGWKIIVYILIKGMIASGTISRRTMLTSKGHAKRMKSQLSGGGDAPEIKTVSSVSTDEKDFESKRSPSVLVKLSDVEIRAIRQRAKTIGGIISKVGTVIIWLIVGIMLMNAFGVDTSALVTGAALVGLAFAFSVQQVMTDFVAGLFLLIENQFMEKDLVEIGDTLGWVENMSLRCTSIRQEDGVLVTIPNGDIRCVANYNRNFNVAMLRIGVTYDTDLDAARKCLEGPVADSLVGDHSNGITGEILEKPFVDGVDELADSSVIIQYCVKCKPGQKLEVERVAMEVIKNVFDTEEGVDLAYPRQEIVLMEGAANVITGMKAKAKKALSPQPGPDAEAAAIQEVNGFEE